MLAAETWHFTIAGAAFLVVGTLIANVTIGRIGEPWTTVYVPIVIGWALLNGAYLAWYFIGRRDQRAIQRVLAEVHGPGPTDGGA